MDEAANTLWLSQIFSWYGGDFGASERLVYKARLTRNHGGEGSLQKHVLKHC